MTNSERVSGHDAVVIPALLRAARTAYGTEVRRALVSGGFEDLPKNGPFVLGAVVNYGFPLGDVVRGLGVSKQAASQLIDLLVIRGYLERIPDPVDRRRVVLNPTERGRAAAAASKAAVRTVDDMLAVRHTPVELRIFRACLSTLIEVGTAENSAEKPASEKEESERSPPPPRFIRFTPIFGVRDLRRSLEHYRSLGFKVLAYREGDQYGFAERDGLDLHLAAEREFDPKRDASEAYLYVDDADALFAEWSKPGIEGETKPVGTMEYRMREGSHIDPDNNVIRFGSTIKRTPEA